MKSNISSLLKIVTFAKNSNTFSLIRSYLEPYIVVLSNNLLLILLYISDSVLIN